MGKLKLRDKLKLGYGVSLPFEYRENAQEYIVDNIKTIKSLANQFNCIQIMFSKSKLNLRELKEIKHLISGYKKIFVHASYKINIGADLIPDKNQTDLYSSGMEIFINEIIWAQKINAQAIVIHMGKNVSNRYDSVHIYNNMVKFIVELFKKLKSKFIFLDILVETPAGQGGEMCWNLEEFVEFICRFKSQPFYSQLGICIDTCHIFQGGLDLNNSKEIKQSHKIFSQIKSKIKLIHLNDSYYSVGKRIDKHEQIGHGQIQTSKLIEFIYPYKSVPMILETIPPYKEQIDLLEDELLDIK